MPLTDSSVSSVKRSGQISASKPFMTPSTRQPYSQIAVFTTARITAFSPAQSPPPLATPIVRMVVVISPVVANTTVHFTPIARAARRRPPQGLTSRACRCTSLRPSSATMRTTSSAGNPALASGQREEPMDHLEKLKPLALLLMRCALGIIFIFHGYPKLFGHTANTQQFFSRVGLPPSLVYVVGVLERFGGGLLIIGLFTRLVGLLLTIEMGVAIWKVHLAHGIFSVKDYEFPLSVAVAAFTLAAVGAGVISLDQPIFHSRRKSKAKTRD